MTIGASTAGAGVVRERGGPRLSAEFDFDAVSGSCSINDPNGLATGCRWWRWRSSGIVLGVVFALMRRPPPCHGVPFHVWFPGLCSPAVVDLLGCADDQQPFKRADSLRRHRSAQTRAPHDPGVVRANPLWKAGRWTRASPSADADAAMRCSSASTSRGYTGHWQRVHRRQESRAATMGW